MKTAPAMPDSIPPTHDMVVGNHVELDFSTFFADEDGDELTYTAVTSERGSGNRLGGWQRGDHDGRGRDRHDSPPAR